MAARCGIGSETQRLPGGDAELLLDEVDSRGLLGDGVLHLQAGVHLKEGDGTVRGNQEFHRSGP